MADHSVIKWSPAEAKILSYLLARPGLAVSYDAICFAVWGSHRERADTRRLKTNTHRIRLKLRQYDSEIVLATHSRFGLSASGPDSKPRCAHCGQPTAARRSDG